VLVARGARYRHVIFNGLGGGLAHAVNLAPRSDRFYAAIGYWSPSPRLEDGEYRFVRAMFERAGLNVSAYRQETLRRRLPACLRALRVATVDEGMLALSRADASVVTAGINAMVIGVTGFFRDAAVFQYLRDAVLPSLPRHGGHPRVWSAGCSDGEEMYSVAMLLAEHERLCGAYLLGTDCRAAALERARDARYDARTLAGVSGERQDLHFVRAGGESKRVCDRLRGAVQWRRGDVTRLHEPGAFDLILCRNLAMYLTPDAAAQLWQQLENALRPGGFLVLGKAERPAGATRLGVVAPCVYRRRSA
jgi:chemotaxis methyl-accepting protein methylase